jgi:hypothetical protein
VASSSDLVSAVLSPAAVSNGLRFGCPATGALLGSLEPFVCVTRCGHVVATSAFTVTSPPSCPVCGKRGLAVPLLPTASEAAALVKQRRRDALARKAAKAKRVHQKSAAVGVKSVKSDTGLFEPAAPSTDPP